MSSQLDNFNQLPTASDTKPRGIKTNVEYNICMLLKPGRRKKAQIKSLMCRALALNNEKH